MRTFQTCVAKNIYYMYLTKFCFLEGYMHNLIILSLLPYQHIIMSSLIPGHHEKAKVSFFNLPFLFQMARNRAKQSFLKIYSLGLSMSCSEVRSVTVYLFYI